jgi:glycosyltransferase involved in cell wall biosynthesis
VLFYCSIIFKYMALFSLTLLKAKKALIYMSSATIRLTVDARMANHSGIGTYIRYLLPALSRFTSMEYINGSGSGMNDVSGKAVTVEAGIYSIKEQLQIPPSVSSCDVFWSPHYNIPIAPVAARKRLVTIHDVYHLAYYAQLDIKQKLYAKTMLNLAVRISDLIITVSEFSRQEIVKYTGAKAEKVRVIPNGVDIARFKEAPSPEHQHLVRDKYRLPEQYILYTGIVKPHKNLLNLLKAYKQLLKQPGMQQYRLVLCGKYEGFIIGITDLPAIIKEMGLDKQVVIAGYVDEEDLPIMYQMASLFVLPSFYEGFGLPPLEAMASKCPVVVSQAASLPEVCGNAAFYIDPYSTGSICQGMYEVLKDTGLQKELVRQGEQRVQLFSWQQSIKAHEQVIQDLVIA